MSAFGDAIAVWFQRRPRLMRLLAGLGRRVPILVVGGSVVVLGADEVHDVLERASDFEIGPLAHRKMLMGPFLLGMDPRPQYVDERKALSAVLDHLQPTLERVARQEADAARDSLLALLSKSRRGKVAIDVVSQFAEPVVTRIASRFFGVGFPQISQSAVVKTSSGEELLAQWLRKIGSVIATTSPAPFGLQGVAAACAPEFAKHLDAQIASRRMALVKGAPRDTVLDQLLLSAPRLGWNDARIRANVAGLMLAGSTALVKSFVHALDQLRRKPCKLVDAIGAPGQLQTRYLFEALRFSPTFPVVLRYCPRATVLGTGESAREVPAGSVVYVVLLSAMFDDRVEDADAFGNARPAGDYLHFGGGQHECLGRWVAAAELAEMWRAFLTLPNLPLDKRTRRIRYDGPAADHYRVVIRR